jgi:hypothetical protein
MSGRVLVGVSSMSGRFSFFGLKMAPVQSNVGTHLSFYTGKLEGESNVGT